MNLSLMNRLALLFLPLLFAAGCGTESPDQAAAPAPASETAVFSPVAAPEAELLLDSTLTDSVVLEGEMFPEAASEN